MIEFKKIQDSHLDSLINKLDEARLFLKDKFGIELKSYGNILRVALNSLQEEAFENLLERIRINRELENALSNAGGYDLDYIGANNPKEILTQIASHLKSTNSKFKAVQEYVHSKSKATVIVCDSDDVDFLSTKLYRKKCKLVTPRSFRTYDQDNSEVVFYSFNGSRDFDFVYNMPGYTRLIVFEQEFNLFQKYLHKRKKDLELEICSTDRQNIFPVQYDTMPDSPVKVSGTIEEIVNRLDSWGERAYNGYRDESDLLLEENDEKIIYELYIGGQSVFLDSNDSVYDSEGNLVKVYKLRINDKIRIYPREMLADNLFHIAVSTEPELFGRIEEHSNEWQNALKELNKKYDIEVLYKKLKSAGLRVLQNTVEAYLKGARKFPMFNSDIRAIISLYCSEFNSNQDAESVIKPILKSKTMYNSTMIALGRGLKMELKLFLKDNTIGEILVKRNFSAITLQKFIDEFMPLQTIQTKDAVMENDEQLKSLNLLAQIEL